MRPLLLPAFVASTVAWLAWLIVAPLLPSPLAAVTYALGSFICHQRPERSFHLGIAQLPVCARCIGIYAGAALASLGWALVRFDMAVAGRRGRWLFVLATMPTAITVAVEWAGVWQPSNIVRAVAGLPLGAAASLVVIGALTTLHYDECAQRRPIVPAPRRTRI